MKCQGTDDKGNDVLLHIELARARHAERARRGERRVDGGEEEGGDHEANNLRGGRAKHGVEGEHPKIRREDARGGVRVEKRDAVRRMDWTNPPIASDRSAILSATLSSAVCFRPCISTSSISSDVLGRCSRPLEKPSFLAYLAFLHRRRRNGSKRGLRRAQTRSRGGVHVLLGKRRHQKEHGEDARGGREMEGLRGDRRERRGIVDVDRTTLSSKGSTIPLVATLS